MNREEAEYWNKLIDVEMSVFPVLGGTKIPAGYWSKLKTIEGWRAVKETLRVASEGTEAFKNAGGTTQRYLDNFTKVEPNGNRKLDRIPDYLTPGLVCGTRGCALDFDVDADETFRAWINRMDDEEPSILQRVYFEKSPHGYHVIFRTAKILDTMRNENGCTNVHLAEREPIEGRLDKHGKAEAGIQTLIETKCEGGFIVIAPSPGYVKLNIGVELYDLPELSEDEVTALYRVARSLSKLPPSVKGATAGGKPKCEVPNHVGWTVVDPREQWHYFPTYEEWENLLKKCGWKYMFTRGGKDWYQRPGDSATGYSGNLTFYNGRWSLYVYTTNSDVQEGVASAFDFMQSQCFDGDFRQTLSFFSKKMCGAGLRGLVSLFKSN